MLLLRLSFTGGCVLGGSFLRSSQGVSLLARVVVPVLVEKAVMGDYVRHFLSTRYNSASHCWDINVVIAGAGWLGEVYHVNCSLTHVANVWDGCWA